MSVATLLRRSALRFPDRPAISFGGSQHATYGELSLRAAGLAGALREKFGLQQGQRVAIVSRNCPEYLEMLWAIWLAGLCAVPVNAKLHPREIEFILGNSGASLCFGSCSIIDDLHRANLQLPRLLSLGGREYEQLTGHDVVSSTEGQIDDPAWLFYTSGTTGRPKGATLTHRSLLGMVLRYFCDVDKLNERDAIIHAAPLSHASGLYSLAHIAAGSNNVIPASFGFDATEACELAIEYGNATLFAAPTMLNRLTAADASKSLNPLHLKTIFYGGAPMYFEDLKRALSRFGPCLIQIYGQGETPNTATYVSKETHANTADARWQQRLMSVGIPRTAVELKTVDERGFTVPPGEVGEIIVRSDVTMKGYWNDEEATRRAIRNGWLYTGDLGFLDHEGFLTLKDRSKDVIISGGSNIYPREIEEILLKSAGVSEAAVIGRPSEEWGEEVVAFIAASPGEAVTAEALDALCLAHIARFKRPRAYYFVPALPKNNYGKVLKTELREIAKQNLPRDHQ
jgi:long-chain acyl-CoA synthetase